MIEVKEVNPVKPADKIVDMINNNNFSSEDCKKIFAALREQWNVLDGDMVTMKDIEQRIEMCLHPLQTIHKKYLMIRQKLTAQYYSLKEKFHCFKRAGRYS